MSWTCPKCERDLKNKNAWHYCEKVDLNSLFENKAEELPYILDAVLREVAQWEEVLISTSKNCVVFVRNKTFLVLKPMKKEMHIKFYSKEKLSGDFLFKTNLWGSKHENHVRIADIEGVTASLIDLIKTSYLMS